MVIFVPNVGYKRGLHFIYLVAVLIETNTVVVFLPESAYLKKKKKKKDGHFCHVKRFYSNKTNQRSTCYYLRKVFLKLKRSFML